MLGLSTHRDAPNERLQSASTRLGAITGCDMVSRRCRAPQGSLGRPKPIAAHAGRCHRKPQAADGDGARNPSERMPPLSVHGPVVAGWSWPGPQLRAARPAEPERPAGLPHRSPGTPGADQAKHRERVRHRLDTDCPHPATPKRPCLRQVLRHQPQDRSRGQLPQPTVWPGTHHRSTTPPLVRSSRPRRATLVRSADWARPGTARAARSASTAPSGGSDR